MFKEVETIEEIGLAVPQETYLMKKLRSRGFDVSDEVFTIEKAKEELLKIFKSN